MKGFLILKWKYCADSMKKAIRIAGIKTNSEYQIPTTNKVDKTVLENPTKLLVIKPSPNCLNSDSTL